LLLAERLPIGLLVAAGVAYTATPYAIRLAGRLQFYDKPVGYKGHARPTPYLGGAAMMVGFVIAVLLSAGDWHKTVPLVGGVALLWTVGTIDDRRTVSPLVRVVIELVLAAMIWATGLGWDLHMGGAVDLTLTCLWVLAIVNAFNLFDNMDGAASTMALVVSAGAALIGIVRGDVWLAVGAASLGGACLGFLPRNLTTPARIFLGDGGSMPLGFAVAVLVMVAASTAPVAWQSLLVALLLVGIPALDTSLVIVSRRRRGISVLTGGQDHLTHRARNFLPSARAVALSLGAVQAVVSVVAVLAIEGGTSFVVISATLYVLAAGGAIVLLERQKVEEFGTDADPAVRETETGERGGSPAGLACLTVVGLSAGLSPFFFAYYDTSVWVPIGLSLAAASAIAVVARPALPSGPGALALGGLLGLGVWSLISTSWAESVENAVVSGNRWLAYGALLVLLLVLLRSERRSAVLLGATGLGVAAVAISVLVRLLGGNPGSLFLGGRLNSPLGYINGEGCLFVIGFWLCFAAAEARRALVAGPAAGMAALMACLAMLSQSRGTALAMLFALVAVVAVVPGHTRRIYGLLVVAGAVALATPELLRVYEHSAGGPVSPATGHAAGRAALLAAIAAGVAWGLITLVWELAVASGARTPGAAKAGSWLLAIPLVLVLILAGASSRRIEHSVRSQWHAFTNLAPPSAGATASTASQSRLLSGGGNRYDYWRIAWRVWHENPILGVGAGNYPRPYYEQRATTEDIDQPHSIELQALSELGLVGFLLLACFIGGIGWGIMRTRPAAARSPLSRALMVGGLGAVAAWLAQTSVDWMHLLPGLTAIAIAAAAVLVRSRSPRPAAALSRDSRLGSALASRPALALGASAVLVTLVVAGASLSRQGLADIYRTRAQQELEVHPASAIADANRSLDIDSDAVETYYVKAAALARFDQATAARAVLRQALQHEKNNFVTWTLLGDISLRQRQIAAAKRDYETAHELNPRDTTLRALAADPSTSL
jgi:UDP-GlcNAc:undecaprenyl-phosphate/decaprenyl-phosphate GlcNAc-1-phosphate transferase